MSISSRKILLGALAVGVSLLQSVGIFHAQAKNAPPEAGPADSKGFATLKDMQGSLRSHHPAVDRLLTEHTRMADAAHDKSTFDKDYDKAYDRSTYTKTYEKTN